MKKRGEYRAEAPLTDRYKKFKDAVDRKAESIPEYVDLDFEMASSEESSEEEKGAGGMMSQGKKEKKITKQVNDEQFDIRLRPSNYLNFDGLKMDRIIG